METDYHIYFSIGDYFFAKVLEEKHWFWAKSEKGFYRIILEFKIN